MYAKSLSNLEKKQKKEQNRLKVQLERKISQNNREERQSKREGLDALTRLIIEDQTLPDSLLKETP